jgi:hypothetical protein
MPILVPSTFYLLCVPAQKPKITESDVLAQTEIFFLAEVAQDTKKLHFYQYSEVKRKSAMDRDSEYLLYREGTLLQKNRDWSPLSKTVLGLWRLLDGKTWSRQDNIFNDSKEDKLS